MKSLEESLDVVGGFLSRHYQSERHDAIANTRALKDLLDDRRERALIASAFRAVLDGKHPAGTLADFVGRTARRDLDSNESAEAWLRKVYEENLFQLDDAAEE